VRLDPAAELRRIAFAPVPAVGFESLVGFFERVGAAARAEVLVEDATAHLSVFDRALALVVLACAPVRVRCCACPPRLLVVGADVFLLAALRVDCRFDDLHVLLCGDADGGDDDDGDGAIGDTPYLASILVNISSSLPAYFLSNLSTALGLASSFGLC